MSDLIKRIREYLAYLFGVRLTLYWDEIRGKFDDRGNFDDAGQDRKENNQ